MWALNNGITLEAHAFMAFNDQLLDVTPQLNSIGIVPMDGDQVKTVVHDVKLEKHQDMTLLKKNTIRNSSYFIYYQMAQKRMYLVQSQIQNDSFKGRMMKQKKLNKSGGVIFSIIFNCRFDLRSIFDTSFDSRESNFGNSNRQMYDDLNPRNFKINAGIYSLNYLVIFSNINGYRIQI